MYDEHSRKETRWLVALVVALAAGGRFVVSPEQRGSDAAPLGAVHEITQAATLLRLASVDDALASPTRQL